MHKFTIIAGAGHCGTMWLSQVINERQDMACYHELRQGMLKKSWPTAAQIPVNSLVMQAYWKRLKSELNIMHVGDANSWAPWELTEVHRHVLIGEVIYLVRNGIQQVHSLAEKSDVWKRAPMDSYAQDVWLRNFWEAGRKPAPNWLEWGRFERVCLLWASNMWMPDWLRGKGFYVNVVRLEDLTTDVEALRRFAPLSTETLQTLQNTDVNRKVQGNRHPNWLWNRWTKDRREAFSRICGPAMRHFGYEVPDAKTKQG